MDAEVAVIEIDSDGGSCRRRSTRARVERQVTKASRRARNSSLTIEDFLPEYRPHMRRRDRRSQNRLNSNVFESFLEKRWSQISDNKRSAFAYFDCLWFSLYEEGFDKTKIMRWIKQKKVFARQYVFVPVVHWGHWNLLILCHFGEANHSKSTPCMLLLDSLQSADPMRLEISIRRFILDIYKSEEREEQKHFINKIPLLVPKVPQQTDGEECGVFVLYFIEQFLRKVPENFTAKEFDESWFCLEEFESFKEQVHSYQKDMAEESELAEQQIEID